ncbi:MAG: 2-oxo-tetronate isomerase [Rhodospirillales bacterium]
MPRFAANLWFLFQELPMLERFGAAAEAGFKGVEMQFPYQWPQRELAQRLAEHGLAQVLINAPPGDRDKGERGIAALPGREREFRDSIALALDYAGALGCKNLHVMAGIPDKTTPRERSLATFADNLLFAAETCGRGGVRVLIEALNPADAPGYLIGTAAKARAVIERVGHDNLYLQYDLYHGAMTGDDLLATVRDNLDVIGHMQVAGVPGRHEPVGGAIDYAALFAAIDAAGYEGWIGCEYRPKAGTREGLSWARAYGIG